jgi:hypothetical protein
MARKTDKRTSNLIIAGGYCLVAIIILLNYLGETSRLPGRLSGVAANKLTQAADQNFFNLQKQLAEEKKVNAEMRVLLRELQKDGVTRQKRDAVFYEAINLNDPLPKLNTELLKKSFRPRPNPFIPGKNPYAPFSKDQLKIVKQSFPFANALRPDANLPFLISGADSNVQYLGN